MRDKATRDKAWIDAYGGVEKCFKDYYSNIKATQEGIDNLKKLLRSNTKTEPDIYEEICSLCNKKICVWEGVGIGKVFECSDCISKLNKILSK